jgi:lipopolysaccharide export system protein LptA
VKARDSYNLIAWILFLGWYSLPAEASAKAGGLSYRGRWGGRYSPVWLNLTVIRTAMIDWIRKRRLSRILVSTTLLLVAVLLGTIGESRTEPQKSDVVHIVSDRLEAHQKDRQIVFLGNVVATHGDVNIRADRMTIHYRDEGQAQLDSKDLGEQVDRIVIEGNVRISQQDRLATGERAVYYHSDNKVVLTGDPRVQQGKDVIKGSTITLLLDSEKGIVEGGPSGPVEAFIVSPGGLGGSFDRDKVGGTANSGADREEGG